MSIGKYKFVSVNIEWKEDAEQDNDAIIALYPMEELGIKEDDKMDKQILYYTDGPDDFFDLVMNNKDDADFIITNINEFFT